MRKFAIALGLLISYATNAQNRTNVWELSYEYDYNTPKGELIYNGNSMDTNSVYREMQMSNSNVSICDTLGNLLFYSNGLTIGNKNYDTLQNAVNFNPGAETNNDEPSGLNSCQPLLILPDPGNSLRYYIFHESGEFFFAYNTFELQPLHLSYSIIDMNLDGGLGGIVDTLKNKYAIVDTLLHGGITATRHANGRDWWIIVHRFYNDKFYKLLLTPDGLQGPYEQTIGSYLIYDIIVQATFSPDGSKYCISTHGGWFDYFDFDRCTGEFSNYKTGNSFNLDSLAFFGSSFSPNSRFLYVSTQLNLYQYDTWDSNMIADVVHVAAWDSFYDPFSVGLPVWFFMHQIAPDGKIYVSTWGGSLYLSVISSPDSLGVACNFEQHSIVLSEPELNVNIPSFPNYDLGHLIGSLCDTLYNSTSTKPKSLSFSLQPNPVTDWLNIIYRTDKDALLTLYNINGEAVASASLFYYFKNRLLNVSLLPQGIYLAVVTENGEEVWSEKVVILH